jgi:hypothetical protein
MLADMGDHPGAVQEFRAARRNSVGMLGLVMYPRSLYLEAVSLEKLGRRDEARRVLKRLLGLWQGADADHATLRRAKALDARLAKVAGPRQGGGESSNATGE